MKLDLEELKKLIKKEENFFTHDAEVKKILLSIDSYIDNVISECTQKTSEESVKFCVSSLLNLKSFIIENSKRIDLKKIDSTIRKNILSEIESALNPQKEDDKKNKE